VGSLAEGDLGWDEDPREGTGKRDLRIQSLSLYIWSVAPGVDRY
jgi:hypothetical protein